MNNDNNIIEDSIEEEKISKEYEHNYIKNRKKKILEGVDYHKRSIDYFKASIIMMIYFIGTSIYNILYSLGNPGIPIITSPLFISNLVSLIGGLVLNSISGAYKKIAKKIFRKIEEKDTFLKMKDEYNSEEVKNILEISNPRLFEKIKSSKLSHPVDLEVFDQMTSNDKRFAFDIASVVKENKLIDKEVEYIDTFEVEDKVLPEITKIRKMYMK